LAIVILTTVIFGSLTPLISKALMPDVEKQKEIKRLKRIEKDQIHEIKQKKLKELYKKKREKRMKAALEKSEKDKELRKQKKHLDKKIKTNLSQRPGSLFGTDMYMDVV